MIFCGMTNILSHVDSESEVLLHFKAIWRKFACDLGFAGCVVHGRFAFQRQTVATELYIEYIDYIY